MKKKELEYTKITIEIDFSLSAIKKAYKNHFGANEKPTKKDLAQWIGSLASADIESVLDENN